MNETGRGDAPSSRSPEGEPQEAEKLQQSRHVDRAADAEDEQARSAGEQLRRAREAQGRSARAVATSLNLPVSKVEALEREDDESLPPPTFVRGYLRSYAGLVGCDPEAVVTAYERRRAMTGRGDAQQTLGERSAQPRRQALASGYRSNRGRMGRTLAALFALALLVVAAVGLSLFLLNGAWLAQAPQPSSESGSAEEGGEEAEDESGQPPSPEVQGRLSLPQAQSDGEPVALERPAQEPATPQPEDASPSPPQEGGTVSDSAFLTHEIETDPAGQPDEDPSEEEAEGEAGREGTSEGEKREAAGPAEDAESGAEEEASADASTQEEGAGGVAADSGADAPDGLRVRVQEGETWLQIEADGDSAFVGLVEGPDSVVLPPAETYELVIGDARFVEVEHRGEPVDLAQHTRDRVARLRLTDSE
ncbi:MAG: helix-turn-helix domain-containing protein [Halorhodospira sp.]